MSAEERVAITIADGVADVQLTRADKMNALDPAMFDALIDAAERLKVTDGLKAVVLSGEGRAFCAGMDVAQFGKGLDNDNFDLLPAERSASGANRPQHAAMAWREVPVPVIAAIHGVALGGGLQIALGADMRFVSADARLCFMEAKFGIIPDMAGFALCRRILRDDVARDLIFSGRQVPGEEAVAIGLAKRLCTDARAEALAYAAMLAERSASALAAAKRLLNKAAWATDAELLLGESEEQVRLVGTAEQAAMVRKALGR